MPTFQRLPRFDPDYGLLSGEEKTLFRESVKKFVDDLARGGRPRSGLRVKGVQGAPGIFELTWAADGRATFQFGKSIREGQPHIIWRRVGGHEILNAP